MKKITLTSILALCMACPAMADIAKEATSATCDSSTIGTTTGPANLQADWTANTINLDWYSNDSKLTVGSTSATCTYDGGITLPSTPSVPTGYTFGGWRLRGAASSCAINNFVYGGLESYIDSGIKGGEYHRNENKYNLSVDGDWALEFNNGLIRGITSCNTNNANYAELVNELMSQVESGGMTTEQIKSAEEQLYVTIWGSGGTGIMPGGTFAQSSTGSNCWCRITSLDNTSCSTTETSWVFYGDFNATESCSSQCAANCIEAFVELDIWRQAAIGSR